MKLVVGLGNPGAKYTKTRHNVGFVVVERLQERLQKYGITDWKLSDKFNAQIAGCTISGNKILLVKPMTFMNNSGQAVQLMAHFFKLSSSDIIVVHDDKDIELGQIKVQSDRGSAGHNGVKSIMDNIGSKNFTRVRIGIGREKKEQEYTAKFVLGKFTFLERKLIYHAVRESLDSIEKLIAQPNGHG